MDLSRLSFLNQLIAKSTLRSIKPLSELKSHLCSFSPLNTRTYSQRSSRPGSGNSLHSEITLFAAGSPGTSLIHFLEQWVQVGNEVRDTELQRIIRTLRSKKRFARALEVSEWMTRSHGNSVASDCAVQLDLIGKVHGIEAAERYFNEVGDRSEKMYGALLNCYVREGLVEKSLSHFNKMKDMGLAKHPLTYSGIMSLYINTHQLEKVPEVLSEMEANGISPDNVSYRMCIKSYGLRLDFTSIEKLLQRMESQPHITMDWSTYTTVASHFIQGGLHERAMYYLQKAEDKVHKDSLGYSNLITLYGSLGDVSHVMRLWHRKSTCRRPSNIDYTTIIGSLVKLGELQEADRIFKEWESSGNLYDFRVPNALLIGYMHKGQVEKAEEMLESIISKGQTPIPNSWSILASGYLGMQNMEKAVGCMTRALKLGPQHQGWEPKPALISGILNWLGENGDVEIVEEFVDLLGRVVRPDHEMYHTLLKAKIRHGKKIDHVLESMKADSIDVNEETKKILSSNRT